jgi:uncharacterized lipoprotein YajG
VGATVMLISQLILIMNKKSGEKMKKSLMLMLGLFVLAGSQHAYAVDADANPIFTNRWVLCKD